MPYFLLILLCAINLHIDSLDEADILPPNFQSTQVYVLPAPDLNLKGYKELRISGSGQFSKMGLEALLKKLGQKSLTIVNLRNTPAQFVEPEVGSGGFVYSENTQNSDYKVHIRTKRVFSEQELAYEKHLGYVEVKDLTSFVDFVKTLPEGQWLHFHDKTGRGKTIFYMVAYDMLRNADEVSLEDILRRHRQDELSIKQLHLLKSFYTWAKENKSTHFAKPFTPLFVLNTLEYPSRLQNFRTTQDLWLNTAVNSTGFENLFISGSSQYSKTSLKTFLKEVPAKRVVVVDLRPDDHLFVNGLNISTSETKEVLQTHKTAQKIQASREALKTKIQELFSLEVHAIDTKYPRNTFDKRFSLTLKPKTVETPEEVVKALGAEYLLIGKNRFSEVADENVDQLIAYVKKQPADTWYHFHCRKGKSRTTLFMTLMDLMQNSDKVDCLEIIRRQKLIGGSDLLDITPKEPTWLDEKESKKKWITFLARFHRYAQENKATHFEKPWSIWSEENSHYIPNVDKWVFDRNLLRD